jgi:uncharacterized protein (TIGR00255 family)
MLLSMTGFSSKVISLPIGNNSQVSFTVEMKALNSRFYELSCRLPNSLSALETTITSFLKNKLVRGRIYLTIVPTKASEALEPVVPALALAQVYVQGARTIKEKCGLAGEVTIADIMALPGLFVSEKTDITKHLEGPLLNELSLIVESLNIERKAEGTNLEQDIRHRVVLCSNAIVKIAASHKELMEEQKKLIAQQMTLSQQGDEEARAGLEPLYDMLNKIDVNEEIIRFKSHLKNLDDLFGSNDIEKGKRIDFIVQELMRETNTIAAKCSNYTVSALTVDIKVELEKIREQVQNIL